MIVYHFSIMVIKLMGFYEILIIFVLIIFIYDVGAGKRHRACSGSLCLREGHENHTDRPRT